MDQFRAFYDGVQDLDRRQLISLSYLKRWVASLVVVFMLFNYIWNSIFSNVRDTHIPFALLPPELQYSELKLPFRSAEEIRNSQINQINFVIFACDVNEDGANSLVNESDNIFELTIVAKEAIRTMKSVTLFTRKIIHFHIFTQDKLYQAFIAELDKWPNNILHRVTFEFHAANYPEATLHGNKDRQTKKACDLSFLFIPSIVKDLDFAIYAKTGTIFLSPVDELWMNFRDYNPVNSLALPLAHYGGTSTVLGQSKMSNVEHVYETTIMQFDIHRLQNGLFKVPVSRKLLFENETWLPLNPNYFEIQEMTWNPTMLLTILNLFKPILKSPGVDLVNIIAFFNPDKIYTLPCDWHIDVTSCNQKAMENHCPNAKVLIEREEVKKCHFNPEFDQLAHLIDSIDLKNYNITQIIANVESLKQSVYMLWPHYSLCSLLNVNSIQFL